MTSDQKTFNIKVFRRIETVKIAFGLVSIRDRLPPQKRPARCSQFKHSNKHIYYFFVFIYFYLSPCIFLLVLRRSSRLEAANPRGSRGGKADLEQPIIAASPDGVPPGRAGRLVPKAPACCLAYRAGSRPPAVWVAEHIPRRRGYTSTCSCDAFQRQHTFWRLR